MKHIHEYDVSRTKLASLFDFKDVSSSFMSPYISAGVVTVNELISECNEIKP